MRDFFYVRGITSVFVFVRCKGGCSLARSASRCGKLHARWHWHWHCRRCSVCATFERVRRRHSLAGFVDSRMKLIRHALGCLLLNLLAEACTNSALPRTDSVMHAGSRTEAELHVETRVHIHTLARTHLRTHTDEETGRQTDGQRVCESDR